MKHWPVILQDEDGHYTVRCSCGWRTHLSTDWQDAIAQAKNHKETTN